MSVLSGSAWDALRHVEMDALVSETGVEQVFQTLDGIFGDPKDVLLIEATDEAFYLTTKQPQEDLIGFQTRLDSKFRKLESAGSIKIPPQIKGFVLAKQAGLSTAEVRELLTLTNGNLQYDNVKQSMRRLMWDFSKPSSQRKVPGAGGKPVYAAETEEEDDIQLAEILADEDAEFSESEGKGVYLAFQQARNKLTAKKLGRGYFPPGADAEQRQGQEAEFW